MRLTDNRISWDDFQGVARADKRLRWRLRLSGTALLWEEFWKAAWPLFSLVGLFIAVSLFGVWSWLSGWPHLIALLCFFCAFVWSAVSIPRSVRLPNLASCIGRLERNGNQTHRPITSLIDKPATPLDDHIGRQLWELHIGRVSAATRLLRVAWPTAGIVQRDRFGVRAALFLLVVVGLVFAGESAPNRLAAAMDLRLAIFAPAEPGTLTAWLTPPDYTGLAPVFLTDRLDRDGSGKVIGPLVVAALANGRSTLRGALFSDDTEACMDGLARLGIGIEPDPDKVINRMRSLGQRGLARKIVGPVALPFRPLLDPLLDERNLLRLQFLLRLGRRHDVLPVLGEETEEQLAVVRLPRNDCNDPLAVGVDPALFHIQPELGLPFVFVRPVTGKAVLGENGTNIPVVADAASAGIEVENAGPRAAIPAPPALATGAGRRAFPPNEETEGVHGRGSEQPDAVVDVEQRPLKGLTRFAGVPLGVDIVGAHEIEPVLIHGEQPHLVPSSVVDAEPWQVE